MSKRQSYEKISVEEFVKEMTDNIFSFATNIQRLQMKDMSFPEWYETMGAWLEVGTGEEEMSYHTANNCSDEECKFCH